MNIKFKVSEFLEALNVVSLAIDKVGVLDTRDVFLKAEGKTLTLYGTNSINQCSTKIAVTVKEEGYIPLDPNQLAVALNKRGTEVEATIISNDKSCKIKVEKSTFKLDSNHRISLLSRLESMPYGASSLLELSAEDIISIFKRSKPCVSTDTNNVNRYIMLGIRFKNHGKGINVTATDGFSGCSLHIDKNIDVPELDIIIPGEFSSVLLSLAGKAKKSKSVINFIQDKKQNIIGFQAGNTILTTTVMAGKFPEVDRIITGQIPETIITLDQPSMKAAVDRILGFESFVMNNLGKIILQAKDNILSIQPASKEACEELVDYESKDGTIVPDCKFNIDGRKLLNIIGTTSQGKLNLGIPKSPLSPIYIQETQDNLTAKYVILGSR
jgi:DNA polymerase III sliding clamp (beta) subunit (PCNA family)